MLVFRIFSLSRALLLIRHYRLQSEMIRVLIRECPWKWEAKVPMENGFSSLIRVEKEVTHETIQKGGFSHICIAHYSKVIYHILKCLLKSRGERLDVRHAQGFVHRFHCKNGRINLC